MKESRIISDRILNRKGDWMWHVIRGKGKLTTVLKNTVEEKRGRGWKRLKLISDVKRRGYMRRKGRPAKQ